MDQPENVLFGPTFVGPFCKRSLQYTAEHLKHYHKIPDQNAVIQILESIDFNRQTQRVLFKEFYNSRTKQRVSVKRQRKRKSVKQNVRISDDVDKCDVVKQNVVKMSDAAVRLDSSERHYRCVRFKCRHCDFVHHIESVLKKHLKKRHPDLAAVESQLHPDQQGVSRHPRHHWRRQRMSLVFPCGINGVRQPLSIYFNEKKVILTRMLFVTGRHTTRFPNQSIFDSLRLRVY